MDCSLSGFSVHGIFQTRMLEWAVISFSRQSSQFRDQTCISCMPASAGSFFNTVLPSKPITAAMYAMSQNDCVSDGWNDITHSTDMSLSKLWGSVKGREAWAAVLGITKSWAQFSD